MSTRSRVGVGKSKKRAAATAGTEAAKMAVDQLDGHAPDIVIVYGTTGYDQQQLLDAISAVTGDALVTGCAGEGVITQSGADEGSHTVAVMAISSTRMRFSTFHVTEVSKDTIGAGRELARLAKQSANKDPRLLVLMPDGLTINCRALLESVEASLTLPIKIAGGTSGNIMDTSDTVQYHNGKVYKDSVSAILIEGDFELEIVVSHGCEQIGLGRTITKVSADGDVLEIDGKPAFDVFKEYIEGDATDLVAADFIHLCVGVQLPRAASEEYDSLVIRTPLRMNKDTGALFFPGGLETGTKIQMTRRDQVRIGESLKRAIGRIHREAHRPALVFQFDCAGRGQMLFGNRTTELAVEPMQKVMGKKVPWIGFHTFGEIAPVAGKTYYHNASVVVCALFED